MKGPANRATRISCGVKLCAARVQASVKDSGIGLKRLRRAVGCHDCCRNKGVVNRIRCISSGTVSCT